MIGQWGVSVERGQGGAIVVGGVVSKSRGWEVQDAGVGVVGVVGVFRFELGGRHEAHASGRGHADGRHPHGAHQTVLEHLVAEIGRLQLGEHFVTGRR